VVVVFAGEFDWESSKGAIGWSALSAFHTAAALLAMNWTLLGFAGYASTGAVAKVIPADGLRPRREYARPAM
jgi:hypothetical protein